MPTIIDLSDLRQAHQNFWLESSDLEVGGFGPDMTVVSVEARAWIGQIDLPAASTEDALRLRAIGDSLRGRAGWFRLRLGNEGTPTYRGDAAAFYGAAGLAAADIVAGFEPYSDGLPFDDDLGFALPATDEPLAILAASIGTSVLTLAGFMANQLRVGAWLSYRDHAYRVESNGAGVVRINPPLRRDIPAGARIEVSRPTMICRLQEGDGWRLFQDYTAQSRPMSVRVREVIRHD